MTTYTIAARLERSEVCNACDGKLGAFYTEYRYTRKDGTYGKVVLCMDCARKELAATPGHSRGRRLG